MINLITTDQINKMNLFNNIKILILDKINNIKIEMFNNLITIINKYKIIKIFKNNTNNRSVNKIRLI